MGLQESGCEGMMTGVPEPLVLASYLVDVGWGTKFTEGLGNRAALFGACAPCLSCLTLSSCRGGVDERGNG